MDEPLSNLDAQLRLQTRTELKRLHRELGTTMIYVTHDQGEAMTLGGRIAVMQRGGVVQIGPPLDLYRQPINTFVGTFLGSPPMNLIDGSRHGTAVTIGVRAEDVAVSASPAAGSDEARVLVVEPMGSETLLTLEPPSARRPRPGRRQVRTRTIRVDRPAAGPRADIRRVRRQDLAPSPQPPVPSPR
jgi:multiple sugar transport system ATP-binding protein